LVPLVAVVLLLLVRPVTVETDIEVLVVEVVEEPQTPLQETVELVVADMCVLWL
jgi:hypothetical protein